MLSMQETPTSVDAVLQVDTVFQVDTVIQQVLETVTVTDTVWVLSASGTSFTDHLVGWGTVGLLVVTGFLVYISVESGRRARKTEKALATAAALELAGTVM